MPEPSAPRVRVLVVDDHDDSRELLEMALGAAGHEVLTAATGSEALAIMQSSEVDVAVVDIGLPDIDGCELARRARARLSDRKPKLIAVTGWISPADRAAAHEAGFMLHLSKPVLPGDLVASVEAVARKR